MTSPGEGGLGFEQDIKPLFRSKDRDSMLAAFDLLDYDDVADNADKIVGSLRSGQMPCDGAWPAAQVDKLQQWIDAGKPAEARVKAKSLAFGVLLVALYLKHGEPARLPGTVGPILSHRR